MSDDNIESEKEFPGLYASEASYKSDSDYGDSSNERNKRELLKSKKKDRNKDKGYAALGGESSNEEMDSAGNKTPMKAKKPKSFKFLQKRDKEEKEDKREDKKKRDDKEDKKKEKKREKEERKKEKERKKIKKDRKKKGEDPDEDYLPIFGVPLSISVERQPSHDGIRLPVVVRECIDYVEDKGLLYEGIYRLGGVKSKIQILRREYNSKHSVSLEGQNPHVVASLLKQYLRELPETVLTVDMMPHFEDVSLIPNPKERSEAMRQLIDRLPRTNRLLLQYVLKHMGNVIEKEKENKMTYQNICIVLSPTMQISHRVLNVMFLSHSNLFGDVTLKRYIPPLTSLSGNQEIEELKSSREIAEEINKQESLLATLHNIIASGRGVSHANEERLWEAQRIVTYLKRRLKTAKRKECPSDPPNANPLSQDLSSEESQKEGSLPDARVSRISSVAEEEKEAAQPAKSGGDPESGSKVKGPPCDDTVVKSSSEDSDRSQEGNKRGRPAPVKGGGVPKDEATPTSAAQATQQHPKSQTIPMLPKPVSARMERSKLSKGWDALPEGARRKVESQVASQESSEGDSPRRRSQVTLTGATGAAPEKTQRVAQSANAKAEPSCDANLALDSVPAAKRDSKQLHQEAAKAVPWRSSGDPEYDSLLEEVIRQQLEHEELLSMNHDLTRKLQGEKVEITRLREEIQEMQTLYGYRTHSYDSSESEGSDSDGAESDSEEDIAKQIIAANNANSMIQSENASLAVTIHKERERVIQLRVALRQAQARALQPAPQTASQPLQAY